MHRFPQLILLAAVTVLFGCLGFVRAELKPRWYSATAEVLVNVDSGANQAIAVPDFTPDRGLDNDIALARSDLVLSRLASRLGYRPSVNIRRAESFTTALLLSAVGTRPNQLPSEANAFAQIFGQVRTERLLVRQAQAEASVLALLEKFSTDLAELPTGVPREPSTERELLEDEILRITSQLQGIRATTAQMLRGGTVAVITTAKVPTKPVSEFPIVPAVRAGVAALCFAAMALALIEFLDDSIRDAPRLVSATGGSPVLALLPRANRKSGAGLDAARPELAEPFRILRTSIQLYAARKRIRILVVTSPGPAEGKSTVALGVAVAFAQAGERVVLVDGMAQSEEFDLRSIDLRTSGCEPVLAPVSGTANLFLLTSPTSGTEQGSLDLTLSVLRDKGFLVIIDAPPVLLGAAALTLARATDATLLVADARRTSVRASREAVRRLKNFGVEICGTVLNGVNDIEGTSVRQGFRRMFRSFSGQRSYVEHLSWRSPAKEPTG